MKSYNKFLILALSFTWTMMVLSSCSEDDFETETEVVTMSDPDTLSEVVVVGIVTGLDGGVLNNAKVELLHGEETFITYTDELGKYTFDDLPSSGEKVALRTSAEGFVSRLGITHLDEPEKTKDYTLAKLADVNQNEPPVDLSLTNNLFEVKGKILLDDETPASNLSVLLISANFEVWQYAISDENGDWSIATRALESAAVLGLSNCTGAFTIEENLVVDDVDIDLGTFNSDVYPFDRYRFTGFVTDCNTGEGLLGGSVSINFEGNTKTYTANITNGIYTVTADNCSFADCYDIKVESGDGQITESCKELFSENISNDYTICGPTIVESNEGEFNLIVDGNQLTFPFVKVTKEAGIDTWLIAGANYETDEVFALQINSGSVSSGVAALFGVANLIGEAKYLSLTPAVVNYTIDSVTTEFMYGSVEGTVVDLNASLVSMNGSFKAVIEQ